MQDMNPIIIREDISRLYGICSNHNFICIEGHTGSGKTTLGTSLSEYLNAKFIDTDLFIKDDPHGSKSYVERIDEDRLSSEIKQRTQSVVLVGICLREVIELLKLSEEMFFIYIKIISTSSNRWMEEYNLDDFSNGKLNMKDIPKAHIDSYRYTLNYEPQSKANVIYERLENL